MGRSPALFASSTREEDLMTAHRASPQLGGPRRASRRLMGPGMGALAALVVIAGACSQPASAPAPTVPATAPSGRAMAVASLDATKEVATLDAGAHPEQVAAPPVDATGPLLVVTDADNTIRSFDPATQKLGPPLRLGAGPHAVTMA